MKIVQVIHGFPPYNMAGSELYTYNLARELAKTEEVYVFHRVADPDRDEYELSFTELDGIKICTINNTFKNCESFKQTYKNDIISAKFGEFLDEVRPDITHFGHLTCLSTTLVEEARKREVPVVFTLHDFWLFCQLGQLLKRDLSLCSGPKDSECARCLAPELANTVRMKKAVESMKRAIPRLGNNRIVQKIAGKIHRQYAKVVFRFQDDAKSQIQQRTVHIHEICSFVDVFIAPSNFLSRKFVEFGIPEDKIFCYDYGFDTALFDNFVKVESEKIRFGYIGTFIPSKGVHVLLAAFNGLPVDNVELRIHGKFLPFHPGYEDYPDYLKSLGRKDNTEWMGEYDNKDVAKILSEIDVLVVPSIWYENSPLTIHEAFMAGVPVITSNIGGMSELVQDEVNGLLFKVGDSRDLRRKMQMIIDKPQLVDELRKHINPVIPIEDHVVKLREIYRGLITNRNAKAAVNQYVSIV